MWRDPPLVEKRGCTSRPSGDPRARDLLRRDRRRARHRGGGDPRERRRLAGRPARALRRRRAGGRVAAAPRARLARRARGARRGGATLDDVDTIAVTQGPGLIGALLVGLSAAKALAWARGLPLVPVDHLHGHVASLYLEPDPVEPPFLCLLASGGHTLLLDVQEHAGYSVLGTTLDDAAGEAFDKGARLLGLGYPGGVRSTGWRARAIPRPSRSRSRGSTGSTSPSRALKTALLYAVRDLGDEAEARRADLAASYQRAIVRALVERTRAAAEREGHERSPSSAASPRTPSSARRCRTPASRRSRSAPTTRR